MLTLVNQVDIVTSCYPGNISISDMPEAFGVAVAFRHGYDDGSAWPFIIYYSYNPARGIYLANKSDGWDHIQ